MAEVVWYVAYGSNLCRARLQEYLDRGPDPTPPAADRALVIGHPLYFAGDSRVWTGGRAYIDHTSQDLPATLARAWLLTRAQWADLQASESGQGGRYDRVVDLGEHEGVPVRTFTGPDRLDPAVCTRPAPAYLQRIAMGLREAHGLSSAEAAAYLLTRPGVAGLWLEPDLLTALGAAPGPG